MTERIRLAWDPKLTPEPLHAMLRTLAVEYPIGEGRSGDAVQVAFVPDAPPGAVRVETSGSSATVHYDAPTRAARGLGALLAGLASAGEPYEQRIDFETFGIMLDCSRNAVMTVEHFQSWLRRLALLGYNMAMLYTEQTYRLEGEEYFGYCRGPYSGDELRRIDQYAASLGIEMIGCIQTLGHLEQTLRWPAYSDLRDSDSVLCVDDDRTYALIEKMIAQMAGCFRSRRIHIGMDETYGLGRGRFLDRFGYQQPFEIITRHLNRVVEICRRYGLQPMLWSDMFFKMGSKTGKYYDKQSHVPDDVKKRIPPEARLVYWDYYHTEQQDYEDFIRLHEQLGSQPVVASGVWTWGRDFWFDARRTQAQAGPCISACRKTGVKDLFFTLWGDDGAYCQFDSALAGLAWCAEQAYAAEVFDEQALARRFEAVCGADYESVMQLSEMCGPARTGPVLWDDPLLGIYYKDCKLQDEGFWQKQAQVYRDLLGRLSGVADVEEPIDLAHGVTVLRLLLAKVQLQLGLDAAYAARNVAALKRVQQQVSIVVDAIDQALVSFRRQWYRRNKPFGFETIQIRLGGLRARCLELAERLRELIGGKIDSIPELQDVPATPGAPKLNWRTIAAGGII